MKRKEGRQSLKAFFIAIMAMGIGTTVAFAQPEPEPEYVYIPWYKIDTVLIANEMKLHDVLISYNFDRNEYGIHSTIDLNRHQYIGYGYNMIYDSNSKYAVSIYVGSGVKRRQLIGKYLLLSGHVGPYIGSGIKSYRAVSYDSNNNEISKTKIKYEFKYGLLCELKAGVRVSAYGTITLGYYMNAPKFKFDGFVDKGAIALGATLNF